MEAREAPQQFRLDRAGSFAALREWRYQFEAKTSSPLFAESVAVNDRPEAVNGLLSISHFLNVICADVRTAEKSSVGFTAVVNYVRNWISNARRFNLIPKLCDSLTWCEGRNVTHVNALISWGLTAVFHSGVGLKAFSAWQVVGIEYIELYGAKGKVCSKRTLIAFPTLFQVFQDRQQSTARQKGLDNNRPKHPIPENRHGLLCGEIALLSLIGVTGLRLGYYALRNGVDARNIGKTIAWAIVWVCLTAVIGYGSIVGLPDNIQ